MVNLTLKRIFDSSDSVKPPECAYSVEAYSPKFGEWHPILINDIDFVRRDGKFWSIRDAENFLKEYLTKGYVHYPTKYRIVSEPVEVEVVATYELVDTDNEVGDEEFAEE